MGARGLDEQGAQARGRATDRGAGAGMEDDVIMLINRLLGTATQGERKYQLAVLVLLLLFVALMWGPGRSSEGIAREIIYAKGGVFFAASGALLGERWIASRGGKPAGGPAS